MTHRNSVFSALLTGFLMGLAALAAFGLLLSAYGWLAKDARAQVQDDFWQTTVLAFCMEEDDLGAILDVLESDSEEVYAEFMSAPTNSCTDIRRTGGRPVPVAMIDLLQRRPIHGNCVEFWRVGDVKGITAITWREVPVERCRGST